MQVKLDGKFVRRDTFSEQCSVILTSQKFTSVDSGKGYLSWQAEGAPSYQFSRMNEQICRNAANWYILMSVSSRLRNTRGSFGLQNMQATRRKQNIPFFHL